jgi:hypothetical protein
MVYSLVLTNNETQAVKAAFPKKQITDYICVFKTDGCKSVFITTNLISNEQP